MARPVSFLTALVFASAIFLVPAGASAAECKGMSKSSCSSSDQCHWVGSFKRKDGVSVKAHCRTSPKKGAKAAGKSATKKAEAKASSASSKGKAKASKAKSSATSKKKSLDSSAKKTTTKARKSTSKAKSSAKASKKKVTND